MIRGDPRSTTRNIPQDAIAATRHRRRWARAEGGGAAAPLAVVAELASPPAGEDEYGHEVVDVANGAAAAAFLAAGHRPRAARTASTSACRGRWTTRWTSCWLALGRRLIGVGLRLMVVLVGLSNFICTSSFFFKSH